jgi:hypothetical protein
LHRVRWIEETVERMAKASARLLDESGRILKRCVSKGWIKERLSYSTKEAPTFDDILDPSVKNRIWPGINEECLSKVEVTVIFLGPCKEPR